MAANIVTDVNYDDAAQQITDPAVSKFLTQFTGNDDLSNFFDTWCNDRCMAFAGYSFEGEQKVEFTEYHKEYVGLWEQKLEGFLAEEGLTGEQFAQRVQEVQMKQGFGPEWVPSMVNECDYRTFFDNMVARAANNGLVGQAQQHTQDASDPWNFSGVFQRDMTCGSTPAEIDNAHKRAGIPYPIRCLLAKGQASAVSTVVHSGVNVTLSQKIPYFPSKVDHYVCDGTPKEVIAPILGWKRTMVAVVEPNSLRVRATGNPNLSELGAEIFLSWSNEAKTHLCMQHTFNYKQGDSATIVNYLARIQ